MTYAPDERRPPEERHTQVALDDAQLEERGQAATMFYPPRARDPFIWRSPAATEEALTMERAAWERADHERRVLRVRVVNLRQALIQCAWAAGLKGVDGTSNELFLIMEVPEAFADRVSKKDAMITALQARVVELESENRTVDAAHGIMAARMHTAEAEAAASQDLAERSLKLIEGLALATKALLERLEQYERERQTPLTVEELHRAAQLVTGWKGSFIAANLELGAELLRRGVRGHGSATATAIAEIDRLHGICRYYGWSAPSVRHDQVDDALAQRKLDEQP